MKILLSQWSLLIAKQSSKMPSNTLFPSSPTDSETPSDGMSNKDKCDTYINVEYQRLHSFSKLDKNGDGVITFEEFKEGVCPDAPQEAALLEFNKVDQDGNGVINREEFSTWISVKQKSFNFARTVILPKTAHDEHKKLSHADQYSCVPPPLFMLTITVLEVAFFIYHSKKFWSQNIPVLKYEPFPIDSNLIYDPYKRYEVWRYVTYMLVHAGYMHLINNIVMQLILGILLELVHKGPRVLCIYLSGVVAGSLATSVVDPETFLAGASGGVYALIFAHMSTVILNWREMKLPWLRVLLFAAYATYDIGVAVYFSGVTTKIGYPAHIGGGIAGLLTGIYILKNLKWEPWETQLWYVSAFIGAGLVLFAVLWNIFKQDFYFPSE